MKYSVSVIIIAYNTEKYIKDCLDSVLSQDLENFEIVIVDNASKDNTAKIITARIKEKNNVNFIKSAENLGGAAAGNLGIRNAQGEYVFLMDSDDIMPKGTLRALYRCAKHDDCDVVIGRAKSIYGKKIRNLKFKFYSIPYSFVGVHHGYSHCRELLISPFYWGKLYKTEFLRNNNVYMPEKALYADLYFSTKALKYARTIAVCDHLSYLWRRFESTDAHSSITNAAGQVENFSERLQSYYDLETLFTDDEELRLIRVYNLVRLLIPVKSVNLDDTFAQFYFRKMREYLEKVSFEEIANCPFLTAKKKILCCLMKQNRFDEFVEISDPHFVLNTYNQGDFVSVYDISQPANIPSGLLQYTLQKPQNCSLMDITKTSDAYHMNCVVNAPSENRCRFLRAVVLEDDGREKYVANLEREAADRSPGSFAFSIPKQVIQKFPVFKRYRISVEFLFNDNFSSVRLTHSGQAVSISRNLIGVTINNRCF